MRRLSATELLAENVEIRDICVFSVHEPLGREARFTDKKRHCSVLFLYLSGKRTYITEDGTAFCLNPNEIMYVPQYANYQFHITQARDCGLDEAIAINFEMQDINGKPVSLGDRPRVLLRDDHSLYRARFAQALNLGSGNHSEGMLLKSVVYGLCYELFGALRADESVEAPWNVILPAIKSIETMSSRDVPIPELARQCGVSETLFRRLFKLYTGGDSAVSYRNRLRLELAERLLKTEQVTVEYAAREAGFRDMSHFYRLYKRNK